MPQHTTQQNLTADAPPALLLVDDERAFVEILSFRLAARGFNCLTCHSGAEALNMLDRQELEVVLLDLNMPGMHGLEVLSHIKSKRPDIEVLLLTGDSSLAVAARGMRRGAGDYLVKPVDFDELLESINKARKRSQEHKESLRASETVKLMALGALAAGIGHEINNPLQVVIQRSEWLCELVADAEQGKPAWAEMAKTAKTIVEQARRCGIITSQLLDLAHKSKNHKAETNLSALTDKMLGRVQERADTLEVKIITDIPEALPLLPCSPTEIEPVLGHLLQNALDGIEARLNLTRKPGNVAQTTKETDPTIPLAPTPLPEERYVRINIAADDKAVTIMVEDSGEGIRPEHLPHIYEPFFSTRPVGKGAGLGLTVCHSIITALRGSISYSPAVPTGAVFTVKIPIVQKDPD